MVPQALMCCGRLFHCLIELGKKEKRWESRTEGSESYLSCRSADWGEIIEWDLDVPEAGFMEGYEFYSGPALREGNQAQNFPCFKRSFLD